MDFNEIYTERLVLRAISPSVISRIFEEQTQEEIQKLFVLDEEGFVQFKEMFEAGLETFRLSVFYFLLLDRTSMETIGECGFHSLNRTHQRAELFYKLHSDEHKRKGFMSEALPQVLKYGFEELNLHRVAALVAEDNLASLSLIRQHQFRFEGVMREDYIVDGVSTDSHCYSLLKPEWIKNQVQ